MLVTQCLLAFIAAVLVVGFWILGSYLHAQHVNQTRNNAAILSYLQNIAGDGQRGEIIYAMRDLVRFIETIESGRYPNMRCDGWYPKAADFARWEHTEIMSATDRS